MTAAQLIARLQSLPEPLLTKPVVYTFARQHRPARVVRWLRRRLGRPDPDAELRFGVAPVSGAQVGKGPSVGKIVLD